MTEPLTATVRESSRDGGGTDRSSVGSRELLLMISAIMALMALAIDLMLPAFDDIREAFDLAPDSNEVARVITVFFLGLAVAQIVWGPLADRFGRKAVLYAGMSIYVLGAVGSALAPSLELLLVSRFVWGLGAAGARVVAMAIIRDRFDGIRMAKAMSQIMAVFMIVPVIAPSFGALIVSVAPWRGVFWFCVIWAGFIALWIRRLPETLAPTDRLPLEWGRTLAGFARVCRTPVTAGYTLATVFLQAAFTSWLASSELLVNEIFGRKGQFPLVFGAVAVLFAAAAIVNGRVVGTHGMERVIRHSAMLSVGLTTALVIISVVTGGTPSFWVFMPLVGLALACNMFLMPNLNAAAMGPMGDIAGTAASLTGASRIAGGALLGAIVDSRMEDKVTPFAVGLMVGSSLALACILLVQRTSAV